MVKEKDERQANVQLGGAVGPVDRGSGRGCSWPFHGARGAVWPVLGVQLAFALWDIGRGGGNWTVVLLAFFCGNLVVRWVVVWDGGAVGPCPKKTGGAVGLLCNFYPTLC